MCNWSFRFETNKRKILGLGRVGSLLQGLQMVVVISYLAMVAVFRRDSEGIHNSIATEHGEMLRLCCNCVSPIFGLQRLVWMVHEHDGITHA